MLKNWEIGSPDPNLSETLRRQGGISSLCADVLISRGILSVEAAGELLNVDALSDPFLLMGMQDAVDRITAALDSGERICVYGDYDCDGVTATVMLVSWLTVAGADVIWYIPTRAEGYGMRCDRIQKLHDEEDVSLIITVDNGISAVEEAKYIKELGMSLVITDHHRPGDVIPEADAVVDPYQPDCASPYKTICGAVVVLKLLAAIDGGEIEPVLEQFGDLAALATIADVMPINGENRFLVQRGLEFLTNTDRVGLLALMAVSGIEIGTAISASAAAFQLIPRINAAGRFGDASLAAKLFLTDDPEEAESLAQQIHGLNTERRETEQIILQEIMDYIRLHPETLWQRVLVFSGENWHHGVIGIVAARLQERFGKPCFLMTRDGECYRGSARGFGAFSVFDCLYSCEPLLVKYGGHPGAGGFTVTAENKDAFCDAIQTYALEHNREMPVMTVSAVRAVSPQELSLQNVKGLEILEPFGH
ncbi:MAG: single-stranded-DNA-specific exonuclease RecJ, partial [Oscillospiraceae bacterium]|nr:single-stranded-DNA-specific exonuclease RecJ [Oscillospiraceae bacterium]